MKVLVMGGGIAGLSAAHELVEQGFEVEVVEARSIYGGKARSIDVPNTAVDGRRPLPGEHGFRFFPGFYRHLPHTMSRIPFSNGKTVADNLVATSQMLLARNSAEELVLPSEPPDTLFDVLAFGRAVAGGAGVSPLELITFWLKSIKFVCSSAERRFSEYEELSWWDFLEAEGQSEGFQRFLAQGVTRSLVAMKAEESSTRTIGTIYFQMLRDMMRWSVDVDRLLNGPTNEVWIDPWITHLRAAGVNFRPENKVTRIEVSDVASGRIDGVTVEHSAGSETLTADYYVLALPVEVVIELVTPELAAMAPALPKLEALKTSWMNGIQYYLDRDVRISHGHGLYLDSPWALTSISQPQFWECDLADYGDGQVKGLLSIVISEWGEPGLLHEKPARECSPDEIREEVWHQLEFHLNDDDLDELTGVNVLHWFLDDSIVYPNPMETVNLEPLLINTVGSWANRPDTDIGLANMFLASDYVRTHTDLATMEAANEAARRAVNEIVKRSNVGEPCDVWPLEEWEVLKPLHQLDALMHGRGLPHVFDYVEGITRPLARLLGR